MVKYYDEATDKTFHFLTNNLEASALTIAELYRKRWQVELFFKWIKQHLRIKSFFGRSENAVKSLSMDSHISLCANINHQKGAEIGYEYLHDFTHFECELI